MAKQAKKFSKVVRDLESNGGIPRCSPAPATAVATVRGGVRHGSRAHRPSVLGRGELVKQELVLADPDAAAPSRDGATPTSVGIAWSDRSTGPRRPASSARAGGRPRGGRTCG